ncbi:MAG: cytochrome C [Sulfurimonas sp.]|nr:cytochrome C [Sulfurimonas sp.]PHQ91099.1 MAG: cytochrome C [Sulfurimonas sp.]
MRKFISLAVAVFLGTTMLSTIVSASAKKGQKYYLKKLTSCKKDGLKSGASFAEKYTREEWEALKTAGTLTAEWSKLCPHSEKRFSTMKEKDEKNLYDFVWKYAADGDIPSCGG